MSIYIFWTGRQYAGSADRLGVLMQQVQQVKTWCPGRFPSVHARWCVLLSSRSTSLWWWFEILLREFGRIAGSQASHRLRLQTVQARRPSLVRNCLHSLDFSFAESFKQSGERSGKHFGPHTSQPVLFTSAGTRWSRRIDARCWSWLRQPQLAWQLWGLLRQAMAGWRFWGLPPQDIRFYDHWTCQTESRSSKGERNLPQHVHREGEEHCLEARAGTVLRLQSAQLYPRCFALWPWSRPADGIDWQRTSKMLLGWSLGPLQRQPTAAHHSSSGCKTGGLEPERRGKSTTLQILSQKIQLGGVVLSKQGLQECALVCAAILWKLSVSGRSSMGSSSWCDQGADAKAGEGVPGQLACLGWPGSVGPSKFWWQLDLASNFSFRIEKTQKTLEDSALMFANTQSML